MSLGIPSIIPSVIDGLEVTEEPSDGAEAFDGSEASDTSEVEVTEAPPVPSSLLPSVVPRRIPGLIVEEINRNGKH